jgi:glycosyltransferase involved in cell wall biosynthesis
MRLQVDALTLGPHGYGEYTRGLVAALVGLGHDVRLSTILTYSALDSFGPWGKTCAELLGTHSRPDVRMLIMPPFHFNARRVEGDRHVAVTMVERGTREPGIVNMLNTMDAVFVPCAYNETLFHKHGVTAPITRVCPPLAPDLPTTTESDESLYYFLSVFEWRNQHTSHKDPGTLIRAYVEEFGSDEPVCLRLKVHNDRARIIACLNAIKAELGVARAPEIEIVQGACNREEHWRLFQTSDAYVSPHHAEGWGLPLFEAMGMGLPTIGTGFSGNLDFMHAENSLLLGYTMDAAKLWANADRSDLRRRMRWLFENRPQGRALGRRAREELRAQFTIARTAEMLEEGLKHL